MSNPKPYGLNELREMFLSFFESKDVIYEVSLDTNLHVIGLQVKQK